MRDPPERVARLNGVPLGRGGGCCGAAGLHTGDRAPAGGRTGPLAGVVGQAQLLADHDLVGRFDRVVQRQQDAHLDAEAGGDAAERVARPHRIALGQRGGGERERGGERDQRRRKGGAGGNRALRSRSSRGHSHLLLMSNPIGADLGAAVSLYAGIQAAQC